MKKHECGCRTVHGVILRKCDGLLNIEEEMEWVAEHGYQDAQSYWIEKHREHTSQ